MQNVLTIDQGNSSAKLSLYRAGEMCSVRRVKAADMPIVEELLGEDPGGIIYCSVGRNDTAFVEAIRQKYGRRALIMESTTPLPIKIGYKTPGTLGLDRIASAVGAYSLYGGERLLVVDAGTAITLDIVDSDGTFLGGNISAGLGLRLKSLHDYTARLPEVTASGRLPQYGEDTDTALRCGALDGAVGEIQFLARRQDCRHIIVTGGDAPLLAERLKEETTIPVTRRDDLVAAGLLRIYEYNETY